MRLGIALSFLCAACGDAPLPDFATGAPPYGFDAAADHALDAGAVPDSSAEAAASDSSSAD